MKSKNLLLLHGALGSKEQLSALKQELETRYNVYSLNFEGHGKENSSEDFSIELFTKNVIDFLQKNNISHTHIFGYSMGGYIALYLSLKHPELVETIVTFGTKFNWNPATASKEVKMLNPDSIEEKVPQFAEQLKRVHQGSNWKEVLSKTASMMISLGNNPPLTKDKLSKIHHYVCIGIGDQDTMVSIDESMNTATQLKNGDIHILKEFKHPIEKNDISVLANNIHHFIDKHG